MFDLSHSAPDPAYLDLSAIPVTGGFNAKAVRVVNASATATHLLLGGPGQGLGGLVVYGTIAAGSNIFEVTASTEVPSFDTGVTALSQTSPSLPLSVLAATDMGVYKCALRLHFMPLMSRYEQFSIALMCDAASPTLPRLHHSRQRSSTSRRPFSMQVQAAGTSVATQAQGITAHGHVMSASTQRLRLLETDATPA